MQIRREVMTHKGEERGYRKRFVAIAHDTVIDCLFMVVDTKPRDEGIDRNHQQDSNNAV